MMEELIRAVARGAGLSPAQAALAVAAALRFLMARLPSAMVGELRAQLGAHVGAHVGAQNAAAGPGAGDAR